MNARDNKPRANKTTEETKQQKKQLKTEDSKYKTKYAQRMNTSINIMCTSMALLIIFAYFALRQFTENDIVVIMGAYLNISNIITENHARFKVYYH